MVPLKPGRRFRRLPAGFDQTIHVLAEIGIFQHAHDPVARDRLKHNPGIVRELPQAGIKPPPHFVGGVIPRPAHVQSKLRQGVEPFDLGG